MRRKSKQASVARMRCVGKEEDGYILSKTGQLSNRKVRYGEWVIEGMCVSGEASQGAPASHSCVGGRPMVPVVTATLQP